MLHQFTNRCWFLPYESETDRPCLGYVRGNRYCLQIDAGNSAAHAQRMKDELTRNALPKPDFVAITHSHWDHTYGLCATEGVSIASTATQRHLEAMSAWTWTEEAMQKRLETREDILFCHEHILLEYPELDLIRVTTADLVFDERLTLDLGGLHAQLLRLANSHADDCVVVFIPEEKVIYLGDICYEDLHHEPPCWHRTRFTALCEALRGLDFDWAVPGHQGLMSREELMADLAASMTVEDLILD